MIRKTDKKLFPHLPLYFSFAFFKQASVYVHTDFKQTPARLLDKNGWGHAKILIWDDIQSLLSVQRISFGNRPMFLLTVTFKQTPSCPSNRQTLWCWWHIKILIWDDIWSLLSEQRILFWNRQLFSFTVTFQQAHALQIDKSCDADDMSRYWYELTFKAYYQDKEYILETDKCFG